MSCDILWQKNSDFHFLKAAFSLVGVRGFEPPASWSRTKRSTKLSHTPFLKNILYYNADGRLMQVFSARIFFLQHPVHRLQCVDRKGYNTILTEEVKHK
jgi:hypothetical protein